MKKLEIKAIGLTILVIAATISVQSCSGSSEKSASTTGVELKQAASCSSTCSGSASCGSSGIQQSACGGSEDEISVSDSDGKTTSCSSDCESSNKESTSCENNGTSAGCSGCDSEKTGESACSDAQVTTSKPTVMAYYFHATRRCATCEAVEKVTKETLSDLYGDKVSFVSINRETEDNPMIKEYEISGQTLLIMKGEETINLTNYAFMNARKNPEKLRSKIEETVNALI